MSAGRRSRWALSQWYLTDIAEFTKGVAERSRIACYSIRHLRRARLELGTDQHVCSLSVVNAGVEYGRRTL
jgi:hypothetical protein